jgi:hypothetical protein
MFFMAKPLSGFIQYFIQGGQKCNKPAEDRMPELNYHSSMEWSRSIFVGRLAVLGPYPNPLAVQRIKAKHLRKCPHNKLHHKSTLHRHSNNTT